MEELDNYRLREMNFDLLRDIYKSTFPMEIGNEERLKIGVILLKTSKEIKEIVE